MSNPTIITSAAECQAILFQKGLLAAVQPQPGRFTAYAAFEYGGCHALACHHCGHAHADDNGYTIILLPKDRFSRETAVALLAEASTSPTFCGLCQRTETRA